jgi:hypothetical protein
VAYLTIVPSVLISLLSPSFPGRVSGAAGILSSFLGYSALVVVLSGAFLVDRGWFTTLRRLHEVEEPNSKPHFQFSILNLLVVTSIVAIAAAGRDPASSVIRTVASYLLGGVVFVVTAVYAARAALSTGSPGKPISLVLLVATLLGVAVAFSLGHARLGVGRFVEAAVTFVLAAARLFDVCPRQPRTITTSVARSILTRHPRLRVEESPMGWEGC